MTPAIDTTDNELAVRVRQLESANQHLQARNQELEGQLDWFKEQFRLARHRRFGPSSEKSSAVVQAELVFNEAESTLDSTPAEVESETITYARKRKQVGHREEVLSGLPTETIEYRLSEQEQVCSGCGNHLHEMSSQVREELEIVPAQVKVIRHVRYVYSCRHCENNEITTPIVTAPAPAALIAKSLASASAVAYVMSEKFVESMPLYRLEKHFERLGVELPRQTLSNWVIKCGEMLEPVYGRLRDRLTRLDVLHADESSVQVLREPGRSAVSKSFMWLYRSGRDGPPIVVLEYQPTRRGEHAKRFLDGFCGYLHVDGYAGYHEVGGARLVGCWAHARRGFVDAINALPQKHRSDPDHLANVALGYIRRLYDIERELGDASAPERRLGRETRSRVILDEFRRWLDRECSLALPKTKIGQAITYCRNQWPKLTAFVEDGRLEIDNNRAERSIKPFVIGRKNWLFANTVRGAQTSAMIYSIVETAKENGLNPRAYLQHLLERLPGVDPKDAAAVDSLLPWSEAVQSAFNRSKVPAA